MKRYLLWSFLVSINTIVSILFAMEFMRTIQGALGVILGVITFILLYIKLDHYLERKKQTLWRKSLLIAVGTFSIIQIYPATAMLAGIIALDASRNLFGLAYHEELGFLATYAATFIEGLILSTIVIILTSIIRFLFIINEKEKSNNDKRIING